MPPTIRTSVRPTPLGKFLTGLWISGLICAFVSFVLYGITYSNFRAAKKKMTRQRVHEVDLALTAYRKDHRRCPSTREDLVIGGYIQPQVLTDTWGTSVVYGCSEAESTVRSAGPDETFNTTDDIAVTAEAPPSPRAAGLTMDMIDHD